MPTPLIPPAKLIEALAAQGWSSRAANDKYVFFQRPGYWLRLTVSGSGEWDATVTPESTHVPGTTWPPPRFAEHELAPLFTGTGARAKALEQARRVWAEHEAYLQGAGVRLTAVGVRQNRASAGNGSSYEGSKVYFRDDIFAPQ